ncbi:MAG: hypothetical protein PHG60_00465 [Candidatus Dojkabacteria bacterium]|nr:hypothetical protein [Candidatus Dojkabacteria bacterium]
MEINNKKAECQSYTGTSNLQIRREEEKMKGLKQPTTLCIKQRAGVTPEHKLK